MQDGERVPEKSVVWGGRRGECWARDECCASNWEGEASVFG